MKRNTYQREMVIKILEEFKGQHPTAERVYDKIVTLIPTISKATVYRLLNQIAEEGGTRRVQIPGSADRYDDHLEDHYHVRCNKCGKIFDLNMPIIEDIYERVPKNLDYIITGHDILFTGLCKDCSVN